MSVKLDELKTVHDAKQELADVDAKMTEMRDLCEKEQRNFTEEERGKYNGLMEDLRKINRHLEELEAEKERRLIMAANKGKQSSEEKEQKELSKYNLLRAIRFKIDEKTPDGLEGEMHQEAVKEMREANTGKSVEGIGVPNIILSNIASRSTPNTVNESSGNQGGHLVPTVKSGLLAALRPRLVLATLGAQTMGGLQGNIDFPKMTAVSSGWKSEIDDADASTPGSSVVSMSPNRLTSILGYSRQLLLQSSSDVEAYLINDLLRSISQNVELAAINGEGNNNVPEGILETDNIGDVEGGTNGLIPTFGHIVDLETKVSVEDADVGSLGYLTNSKVRGKLKQTLKDSGVSGYIWEEGNELNGYRAAVTNLVPSDLTKGTANETCSAIIFGNFNDLIIGNWGGMDIVVDPYTAKKKGVVEIAANTYWDVAVLRTESFAAMQDALTE